MDLSNILHLYSIIIDEENRRSNKPLPKEVLKSLSWKPTVVSKKTVKTMDAEKFLEGNLGNFFKYMLEYSEF